MSNIEQSCANVRTKLAHIPDNDEVNAKEFAAFINAMNHLLDEVIAEQRTPDPNRKTPRWARNSLESSSKRPKIIPKDNFREPKDSTMLKNSRDASKKLITFLGSVQEILTTLKLVALHASDPAAYPTPGELLEQLTNSYSININPMFDFLEANAQHIEQVAVVAGLGIAVFSACREINKYRDKLDTNEKLYAVAGIVLLATGVAMLVAATVNPTTMPIVAAITVLALGRFLCKRATQKHKNEETKELDKSLHAVQDDINKTSNKFELGKATKAEVMFSAAKACHVKHHPPEPTLGQRVAAQYEGILRRWL